MSEGIDATAAHQETVRALSAAGGPLDKDGPYASIHNPAWFRGGRVDEPRAERRALWRRLREEVWAENPGLTYDRKAIVLAGPPGAGKSTVLRNVIGLREGDWLVLDADDFKHRLLREAIQDGSYETFLKPPEVTAREAAGEPFYPLEFASLVHEESSALARHMRQEALSRGANVVIDSVLSSPAGATRLGSELERAGYEVEVIDVEVPFDLSQQRIAHRWREAYQAAVSTGEGLGGRWVPSVYARSVFSGPDGRSRCQEAAQTLVESCPSVMRFRRFWTAREGERQQVEVDLSRLSPGADMMPTPQAGTARRAAASRPPSPHREQGAER